MKNSLFIALLSVITVAHFSCKKSVEQSTTPTTPKQTHVYASGGYSSGNESRTVYWKDGIERSVAAPPGLYANAYGVAVSDTDVYIVGDFFGKAVYWKNTVQLNLDPQTPGGFSASRAIAISGKDVYIAGIQAFNNGLELVFRKNDVKTVVPAPGYLDVTGIAVANGDVYISGTMDEAAVYWKNGIKHELPGKYAKGKGIAVSGSDVYVAGEDGAGAPVYWKNGVMVALVPSSIATVNGISVSGSDVFIVGTQSDRVAFWKNNIKSDIESNSSTGTAVTIHGSDVYVAGLVRYDRSFRAAIWKNGVKTEIGTPTDLGYGTQVVITSVTVVDN